MRKWVVVVMIALLTGCSSYAGLRDSNRQNIMLVEPGMSKAQVINIMGDGHANGVSGSIRNPYKREATICSDGKSCEVLYYYTDEIGRRSIEAGMTPIVFRNGAVIGIGWSSYDILTGSGTSVRLR